MLTLAVSSLLGGCSSNGLSEDEMQGSISTLHAVAAACDADMTILRKRTVEGGLMSDCLVRKKVDEEDFLEVRYGELMLTLLLTCSTCKSVY